MFLLTSVVRELQRRTRQAALVSAGLAVGVGLVMTVTAASAGVAAAQASVLHSLFGLGTDLTVTQAPPRHSVSLSPFTSVFTPGPTAKSVDALGVGYLNPLDASSVAAIARLPGVRAAAGGLQLTEIRLTVPSAAEAKAAQGAVKAGAARRVTVDGVDVAHLDLGPFSSGRVIQGRTFAAGDAGADVAVVDSRYAATNGLASGSMVTIAGAAFRVIGILRQPEGGGSADVYIPLAPAQALTQIRGIRGVPGKVNAIYVNATGASAVGAVRAEIQRLLPSATVTTSGSLAGDVSGSLASASRLIANLGRWLTVAGLTATFAIASLLMLGAVARRVREFGTLSALGWPSRWIVAKVMGEAVVVGCAGAVLGIALGFAGAALIERSAPPLAATVAQSPGAAPATVVSMNGTGTHTGVAPGSVSTVAVHLTAPVTAHTIVLAVVLAMAGAVIAGAFGAWRAARLRPSEALTQVE